MKLKPMVRLLKDCVSRVMMLRLTGCCPVPQSTRSRLLALHWTRTLDVDVVEYNDNMLHVYW
jgi:hypothetical protein